MCALRLSGHSVLRPRATPRRRVGRKSVRGRWVQSLRVVRAGGTVFRSRSRLPMHGPAEHVRVGWTCVDAARVATSVMRTCGPACR
jgi:hypothetical protein